MRVALISTPFTTTRMPPLSLGLMAACLKQAGHHATIFDLNQKLFERCEYPELFAYSKGWMWKDPTQWADLKEKIIDPLLPRLLYEISLYRPEMIGISAWHTRFTKELGFMLRRQHRDIPIVAGGPICSAHFGSMQLQPDDNINAVVTGEGEIVLPQLASLYERYFQLMAVPGVTLLHKGQIKKGEAPIPLTDLDSFPDADFSSLDLSTYTDADFGGPVALPLLHSRGCHAACSFCMDRPMWGEGIRSRSAHRTAGEISSHYEKYKVRNYLFLDLTLNAPQNNFPQLVDALARIEHPVDFCGQFRISRQLTVELLQKMKAAGFVHLTFGLESASDNVLGLMRKGYDNTTAQTVLNNCQAAGLLVSVNLITGFPGETKSDVEETMEFIRKNSALIWAAPSVTTCSAPPASQLGQKPEEYDIILPENDPEKHENWISTDGTNTLTIRRARQAQMNEFFQSLKFLKDME